MRLSVVTMAVAATLSLPTAQAADQTVADVPAAQSPTGAPPDRTDRAAPVAGTQDSPSATKSVTRKADRTADATTPDRSAERSPAAAASGKGERTGTIDFKSLDTNGDGYLSRAEADKSGVAGNQFLQLDRDGDGRLSRVEAAQSTRPGTPRTEKNR